MWNDARIPLDITDLTDPDFHNARKWFVNTVIPTAEENIIQTLSFNDLQTKWKESQKLYNISIVCVENMQVTLTCIFPENSCIYSLERASNIYLCSPQWIL